MKINNPVGYILHIFNFYALCRDFRKPSKVLYKLQEEYAGQVEITYDIYKDKYWQSFNRFNPPL